MGEYEILEAARHFHGYLINLSDILSYLYKKDIFLSIGTVKKILWKLKKKGKVKYLKIGNGRKAKIFIYEVCDY